MLRLQWISGWLLAGALAGGAAAQSAGSDSVELPTIEVVGTSPLGGSQALDKVPANIQTLDARDLAETASLGLAGALDRRLSSVGVSEASGNALQPSLSYRGFDASPVAGTPQGLAVYQNGVRINEAFGDSVNWDFIPTIAVDRVEVGGNNPAFGLNALGGAVRLKMKDGFSYQGAQVEVMGGSFGRFSTTMQVGKQVGDVAAYLALEGLRDSGFRLSSASTIRRFHGDIGVKVDTGEVHLNIGAADNAFGASAAVPVELLRRDWSAIYTTPQTTRQSMQQANVTASLRLNAAWTVDANAYVRAFQRRHVDGNTTEVQPCAGGAFLCFGDDVTPANGLNGLPLADTFNGAQLGQIDRTRTLTRTFGASAQATHADTLLGRGNRLQMGASLDYATTRFAALSELGVIGGDFRVTGSGVFLGSSGSPTAIGPVGLDATSTYLGAWVSDTLDITRDLSATLGGRFNGARIVLEDQLGSALNGVTRVQRFNPMAGLTYKLTPELIAYAGYSQANRAPTPLELGCSDPNRPCLIDSFLVSDPPLKQVVASTAEAGLRGVLDLPEAYGRMSWKAGLFRTDTRNEILNVPSPVQGFGYFANVGGTRRQGLEFDVTWRGEQLSVYAGYTLLDATFRDALTLSSPNNPSADANGQISVAPGKSLPMNPRHRFKFGADYAVTDAFKLHADTTLVGAQYLEGDAANQNARLPAYAVVNVGVSYRLAKSFEVFARVDNLLDRRYYAFGTYFEKDQISFAGFTDPRTFSPARPRTIYVGARATF